MPEAALLSGLRTIVPDGAGCAWADPAMDHGLMEGEALPGAIPKRLREFSAGRAAARLAMAELGCAQVAIPHGQDRAPIWPDGLIGSITHTATQCLSIVLPSGGVQGIGIDLEPRTGLDRDLWSAILTPEEQANVGRIPDCHQANLAKTYFSAKEAAYKAQYPLTQTMLDFHDLALVFAGGGFEARFQKGVGPLSEGSLIKGRFKVADGHVLAVAWI